MASEVVKADDLIAELGDAGPSGWRAKRGDPVKCGVRVALGVVGGYFLGRTKKMKLAMMLGGLAAGRQAGGPGQLLAQGAKLLGQSPELTRLTDELGGRLLDAGKAAAVAVATRQVENLVNRVGTLTDAGVKTVGDAGGTVGGGVAGVGTAVGGLGPRQSQDDVEDVEDVEYEEEPGEEEPGEEEPGEEEPGEPTDLDEARDDSEGGPSEVDEDEARPPRRRSAAVTGSGGKGGVGAVAKGAGGAARLAGKATAARAGRRRPRTAETQ
jgi:hypothetical protein